MLEHLTVKDYTTEDSDDPYAMFFIVQENKNPDIVAPSEQDVLQAAMNAMVRLFESENPDVQTSLKAWMDGRIRKIVKRAKNTAWDRTGNTGFPYQEGTHRTAKVRVFLPIPVSQQPAELRKLQVTGLQVDSIADMPEPETDYLKVYVNKNLAMSTGKLIAQVGHAVQLFLMGSDSEKTQQWLASERKVFVEKIDNIPTDADAFVHDAGFTEVPAGSLTAASKFIQL